MRCVEIWVMVKAHLSELGISKLAHDSLSKQWVHGLRSQLNSIIIKTSFVYKQVLSKRDWLMNVFDFGYSWPRNNLNSHRQEVIILSSWVINKFWCIYPSLGDTIKNCASLSGSFESSLNYAVISKAKRAILLAQLP